MSTSIDPQPGQQPYTGQPAGYDNRPTSVAAITGLVFAFLFWPLGLVLSIVGISHTKPGRKKGRGLALAGLILSAVFGLIGILVIAALAGGSSGSTTDEAAPAAEAAPADAAAAPAAEPAAEEPAAEEPAEDVAGLNTAVRDGKFEFTVHGMECGETLIGSDAFGAKAQGQFCIVDLTVANIGDEAQYFFGDNAKLINAAGQEYSADTEAAIYLDDSSSLMEEINPGNKLDGKVVFDVPEGADITTMELHDSAFSGGVQVSLK
ncbi:DUF4352 domain-containing protein [Quadrisphaera sp. KR29]|uniref:DUF4352 domain-containing protein n=1 Tax=Quadrisphaera sp. KR29 TaxID=3461391 RepID=UPI004044A5FD